MASIYALVDAVSGETRYIGKANNPEKRLKSHMRDSIRRDTPVYRWIRKNGPPKMVVLIQDSDNWVEDETRIIAQYKKDGANLLNVAIGGDQPFCSTETRAENGRKNSKARVDTDQKRRLYNLRRNMGISLKRGYVSEQTKEKLRLLARLYPADFGEWAQIK